MKRYLDKTEKKLPKILRYVSGIVLVLFSLAMCFWVSWWWLILLFLCVDVYFTRYINWNWYKTSKSKIIRFVMGWVMDIAYAVVAISIISLFFFQNFTIPSSSLEKTMLIGDYLFVNKLSYGPRLPMTPIAVPLVHNEMPIFGGKSYLEKPSWKYRRVKGLGSVERNDLVVFNFPAGDTVAVKMPNPDYYTLCKIYGRDNVRTNKFMFGDVVFRPIDKRDFYVKRCVGLPGDTLQIIENQLYINNKKAYNPKHLQYNYFIQTDGTPITKDLMDDMGINYDDMQYVGNAPDLKVLGLGAINREGSIGAVYHSPLTEDMVAEIKKEPYIKNVVVEKSNETDVYPLTMDMNWNRDNYGPIIIPRKGMTIKLDSVSLALYSRCIHAYEGHSLETSDNHILIDGKEANTYTFEMDYYWMMGDNRHNSADSRYWGFVPEDHIVGKPAFIWYSRNKDKGLFNGGIRWGRMMRMVDQS